MSLKLKIILGIFIFFAGFLVIRLALIFNKTISGSDRNSDQQQSSGQNQNNSSFDDSNPLTKDSDQDGLPDRDEIIFGTDPFNKDTDGDGFLDGEEVASGHDPLDSSADDGGGLSAISSDSQTANLTTRLINMGLASLLRDDGSLDPSRVDPRKFADIIGSINQEASLYLTSGVLGDKDIILAKSDRPDDVKKYLDTVGPIIEGHLFSLVSQISSVNGVSDSVSKSFGQTYDLLKTIAVPPSWKELHKQILFDMARLAGAFGSVTDLGIAEDPIKASFALNQIQDSFLDLNSLLQQASNLAKKQNINIEDSIIKSIQSANTTP